MKDRETTNTLFIRIYAVRCMILIWVTVTFSMKFGMKFPGFFMFERLTTSRAAAAV